MVSHHKALSAVADQSTTLNHHQLLLHSHLLNFDQECDKLTNQVERALAVLNRDIRRRDGLGDIIHSSGIPISSTEIPLEMKNNEIPSTLAIPPVALSLLDPTIQQPVSAEPITLDFSNLIPAQSAIEPIQKTGQFATGAGPIVGETSGDLVIGGARDEGMDMSGDINLDGMMGDNELEALLNSLGP